MSLKIWRNKANSSIQNGGTNDHCYCAYGITQKNTKRKDWWEQAKARDNGHRRPVVGGGGWRPPVMFSKCVSQRDDGLRWVSWKFPLCFMLNHGKLYPGYAWLVERVGKEQWGLERGTKWIFQWKSDILRGYGIYMIIILICLQNFKITFPVTHHPLCWTCRLGGTHLKLVEGKRKGGGACKLHAQ